MSIDPFTSAPRSPWNDISQADWDSSTWQLRHRIKTLEALEELLPLTEDERAGVVALGRQNLSMAVTPYFFTLIDRDDPHCPIRRQVIPTAQEFHTDSHEMTDPCGEEKDTKVPGLVHRYPDRVLLLATDRCASYCRYCTRSRLVSGTAEHEFATDWEAAYSYLDTHPEVRDVLLSGGDPLLLTDERLDAILTRLQSIPHIEILRLGTRVPIFLPQRITPALCAVLRKHAPLYLSLHVNHPRELSAEAKQALDLLADHGIIMGSQTVLLKGINDTPEIQKQLWHKLLRARVRPYYLYQCDLIQGSAHFRADVRTGMDIIRQTRGFTSGYAIPQYIIDGPGGGGKIPINPTDYITAQDEHSISLSNFRHESYSYPLP